MLNITSLYSNQTQMYYVVPEHVKNIYLSTISSTFCLYLPSVIVVLCVIFSTSHFRNNVRYLLFSHMIISDTIQLTLAFILFVRAMCYLSMPLKFCCFIAGITTAASLITPYNLALMSLERYIAVCFPLRHGEICTIRRCNVAIMVIWVIAAFPIFSELIIYSYLVGNDFLSLRVVCVWRFLIKYNFQITLRFFNFSLSFTIVVITIFYTYIRVTLVARKIGSRESSASKAAKTVLLHAFQLFLSTCLYTSTFTETLFRKYYFNLAPINFLMFICLPHYISPLIYGIRDKAIRNHIKKLFVSTRK